jgi:hypothetical protein
MTASFEQEYIKFEYRQVCFNSSNGTWSEKQPLLFSNGNISILDNSTLIDMSTALKYNVNDEFCYENDLSKPIPDTDPIQYQKKLKDGFVGEYDIMFSSIGMQIIDIVQNELISRVND